MKHHDHALEALHGLGMDFALGHEHHALAYLAAADTLERETGVSYDWTRRNLRDALTCFSRVDFDTLLLDTPDGGGNEVAEGVGANEHLVVRLDDARLDDARHNRADERNRERVADVQLERRVGDVLLIVLRRGKNVQEAPEVRQVVARHIREHEHRADLG